MLEILGQTTDACVVFHAGGRVSGEEYKPLLDAVDERLKERDKINMVAELEESIFYGDLEAFKDDYHFGTHEYRSINRMAFVGDAKWVELFVKVAQPFTKAEEKLFPSGSLDEAIAWACSDA